MISVLFRRAGDHYTVKFSYAPDLVELLKITVPGWARSWDSTTKERTVAAEFGRTLASAMQQAGHTTVGFDEPRSRWTRPAGPRHCSTPSARAGAPGANDGAAPEHLDR
jgi:hypothetical protein